ncbi:MAG: beta-eliminating lyase-related protein [Proteobacteria bacterium]|nr:beta-eliminating lyase-related protein [Pseudomonadota bacterium]
MASFIDFRSDTVTKPTPAMLDAMMKAKIGDDVYGEDQSTNDLETRVAKLLGKDAGLFTPSGTMANQIAIHMQTLPGTSVLAEQESHVFLYEAGAASALSGIQFDLIPFESQWSNESIDMFVKPEWLHYPTTKLLVVENTHNRGSGRVLDSTSIDRIAKKGREHGLSLHCDGARLWNAAQALKVPEIELVKPFDTVSVCFSKGLGAPVGSVLVGTKSLIDRARKIRKRWGGGMRQVGFLTAACHFALDHNRERLLLDHTRVKMLHDGLMELKELGLPIESDLPTIWTNILYFTVRKGESLQQSGDFVASELLADGIKLNHLGHGKLRIVTHLEISDQDIGQLLKSLRRIIKSM